MRKISDLYYGKAIPPRNTVISDSQYEQLLHQCDSLNQVFEELLSPEAKKLYRQLTDMQSRLSLIAVAENYVQGFRDGAGIIIDIMMGKNDNLM